jgi:hypothetical protein
MIMQNGSEVWAPTLKDAFHIFVEKYGHIKAERILDKLNDAAYLTHDEREQPLEEFIADLH